MWILSLYAMTFMNGITFMNIMTFINDMASLNGIYSKQSKGLAVRIFQSTEQLLSGSAGLTIVWQSWIVVYGVIGPKTHGHCSKFAKIHNQNFSWSEVLTQWNFQTFNLPLGVSKESSRQIELSKLLLLLCHHSSL